MRKRFGRTSSVKVPLTELLVTAGQISSDAIVHLFDARSSKRNRESGLTRRAAAHAIAPCLRLRHREVEYSRHRLCEASGWRNCVRKDVLSLGPCSVLPVLSFLMTQPRQLRKFG